MFACGAVVIDVTMVLVSTFVRDFKLMQLSHRGKVGVRPSIFDGTGGSQCMPKHVSFPHRRSVGYNDPGFTRTSRASF
jgi:hypothetical protein